MEDPGHINNRGHCSGCSYERVPGQRHHFPDPEVVTSSTTEGPTDHTAEHPAAREHDPRKACKALIGAYAGTSLEWYDFFLFGATASIVFAPLFFGGEDPALAVLRIVQGMAVGGEWGGATLLAVENAPEHKRGFSSAVVQLGSPTGTILSSMIVAAVVALSGERFLEGAWRIPYLISIVLVAVGVWIRLKIDETDVCKQAEAARSATPHEKQSAPVADTLRAAPGRLIVGIGTYLFGNAGFFVLTTFMISYVTKQLGLPSTVILTAIVCGGRPGPPRTPLAASPDTSGGNQRRKRNRV
ncbi:MULTISPECIES: MFS transporter [Kocuria]|uniref:MFS transporter n=1 Tax=Kocuria TaxID=57493 RepID=UPI0021A50737|nr:MFS transporter [Kocuria sp.]MCT1616822.1 MFS transporter [Kocuria marina]